MVVPSEKNIWCLAVRGDYTKRQNLYVSVHGSRSDQRSFPRTCRKPVQQTRKDESETINAANLAGVNWDEDYFKFCDFEGFSIEGGLVASDFVGCSFSKIDWYWGLFSGCNFIDCSFADCTFAGTNFADTRFVDCKLVNCAFKHDNLGCDCDLSKTIVYGCSAEHTSGFPHNSNLAIPSV